jgi:hypothetical protein
MNQLGISAAILGAAFAFTGLAQAEEVAEAPEEALASEQEAPEESAPEAPAGQPEAASTAEPEAANAADNSKAGGDGGRFRFGISGGPSFFSVKDDFGNKVSLTYGGMDLRFGMQVNDLLGVYAQPVLGFYGANSPGVLAAGGLIGAGLVADVTLIDHFFVGGGLGYHVYNNPAGPSLMLRGGAYPLMGRSKEKIRRKGLMLGVDLRVSFLSGLKPIMQPTFNLGYEAF